MKRILRSEVTEEDCTWLHKAQEGVEILYDWNEIFTEWAAGGMAAWRLDPGILMVRVVRNGIDTELQIYVLATERLLGQYRNIMETLKCEARRLGCKRLSGLVQDPRLVRLHQRYGGRIFGTYVGIEV